ncbi:MAG: acyl-CoA dehydrogenase family protein [Deltaproteobacteria bacterium]|jgi:acyl-CoA dehydrogenase|nr:acyl-CoA dehydrogenase family protein [Deltaproteobacteria bacterium]
MIDFELEPQVVKRAELYHAVALNMMRSIARKYDEEEHTQPWDFFEAMWAASRQEAGAQPDSAERQGARAGGRSVETAVLVEEMCWGDAGLFLTIPGPGLGGAAVRAAGTPAQQERFLARFKGERPVWGAMAITEPGCGSDSAAVTTSAVRQGDYWVLNGTKIFCTAGQLAAEKSDGLVVVWATLDRSLGRAGIRPFVVERGTPGMSVVRVENKLGIRASDTAAIVFEDCRVPLDHLLGDPELKRSAGFKEVMATFDATRPIVAAMAIGVGRAALDFVREFLAAHGAPIRYGLPASRQTALEAEVVEMEVQLKAARLLTWRAAWMFDRGMRNNLEASMAKAKAGRVVTRITQKAVELLGPLGYSRELLVEKWMRDAKINDIFEGTQQINMLIVARRVLGYSSAELS